MRKYKILIFAIITSVGFSYATPANSKYFSVNWLAEVVGKNQSINLNELTTQLDQKIGSAEKQILFLNDWVEAVKYLAKETTRVHEVSNAGGWKSLYDMGYRKFDFGGGPIEIVLATNDKALFSLIDGGMGKALEYAMISLNEEEWTRFKRTLTNALAANKDELTKVQTIRPDANVNYLAFMMAGLINDLSVLQRLPSNQREDGVIQKLQLRKMDLLEMVMNGQYLSADQKSMILNNVAFAFESAVIEGSKEGGTKAAVKELLSFEPLLGRLQALGKYLPKSGSIEYKHGYEYFRIFVGQTSVEKASCKDFYTSIRSN